MTARPRKDRNRDTTGGFLLVEVLAALTITALVLAGMLSLVSLMRMADMRISLRSDSIEAQARIMDALARDIGAARPVRLSGSTAPLVFSGDEQSLTFARIRRTEALPALFVAGRLESRGLETTLSEWPLAPDLADVEAIGPPERRIVYQGRYDVRLSYFGRGANDSETLSPAWTNPDRLPVAVRIALLDDAGNVVASRRVPIRVDGETGCAAPNRARCGDNLQAEEGQRNPVKSGPVDADDSRGWLGFAK